GPDAGRQEHVAGPDAPAAGRAQRADGVPDRASDRSPAAERRARAFPELRRLRALPARPGQSRRAAVRADPADRRPVVPDRTVVPLQRQVLPGLATALPRLPDDHEPAPHGAGGALGRGAGTQAAVARPRYGRYAGRRSLTTRAGRVPRPGRVAPYTDRPCCD